MFVNRRFARDLLEKHYRSDNMGAHKSLHAEGGAFDF
jgi:hypothetical protein